MARLPFDPKRVSGPDEPKGPARREARRKNDTAGDAQLTVSQVAELVKSTLESRIPASLRVIGQVSNLSTPGHWYFSLKDDSAVLHCVAWASSAGRFGFAPRDGDEVVATGHISHYGPQGRTQLYVTGLRPVGAGALELRFRAMCEELRGLGYFDEARKKPLPVFPGRIAVITSAGGAAVQDVIATAAQRCKAVALLIVDVRVQGEGAAQQVASAIRWVDANHARLGVDAILVTRGGGSIEDLWAFNERIVADAAFASSIPLVAAIGHESDTTVIELVADLRAATPTQAAMRLVPSRDELLQQIEHGRQRGAFLLKRLVEQRRHELRLVERHPLLSDPLAIVRRAGELAVRAVGDLSQTIMARLSAERVWLERLAARLGHLRPQDLTARRRQALAVLSDRLRRAAAAHVRWRRQTLDGVEQRLNAVGPQRVLGRGYSITTDMAGHLIRSVSQAKAGQSMITRLSDGSIESVVGRSGVRAPRSAGPDQREQMDLFDAAQ